MNKHTPSFENCLDTVKIIEAVEKELDLIAQYDDQLEMMNKYFSDEDDTKLLKE